MPRRFPPIRESIEELEVRMKGERDAQLRRRIHMLVLIRSRKVLTRKAAAEHLAVHRNSIATWLSTYATGGLEALLQIKRGGPKAEQRTLPPAAFQALQERLKGKGFPSYGAAQRWLKQDFGLAVPYKTVWALIRRTRAKLKRARPSHIKKRR